jgi:hypothetical protein
MDPTDKVFCQNGDSFIFEAFFPFRPLFVSPELNFETKNIFMHLVSLNAQNNA